jgi:lipopolysaccharide export system permease protein
MAQRDNAAQALTFSELKAAIEREKIKGSKLVPEFEIELYTRTAFPFATYILTIIGVSVASQKKRGGIGINIAIGLAFVFVYIFAMKMLTVAAIKVGLSTFLAVWMPNLIFAVIAVIFYKRAQK